MPEKKVPWLKYFFSFTIPALLLSLKSGAQSMIKAPIEMVPVNKVVGKVKAEVSPFVTVEGSVLDENGKPLMGATITVKGGSQGIATDSAGRFKLSNVAVSAILVVQYIGYEPREVPIQQNQKEVSIQLSLKTATLGEVVVTGFVVAKKRSVFKSRQKETVAAVAEPVLLLYPNPVLPSADLHLQCGHIEPGSYMVEVYAENGMLLQSLQWVMEKGKTETTLPLNALANGSYFLKLTNLKTGRHLSRQFRVQQ